MFFSENVEKIGEQLLASVKEGPLMKMPKLNVLLEYQKRITKIFEQIGLGKTCLCHNDENQRNLIYNPKGSPGNKLALIDFGRFRLF